MGAVYGGIIGGIAGGIAGGISRLFVKEYRGDKVFGRTLVIGEVLIETSQYILTVNS